MTRVQAMARELFLAAIELPADKRSEFIKSQCHGKPELETAVRKLMAAYAEVGSLSPSLDEDSIAPTIIHEVAQVPSHRIGDSNASRSRFHVIRPHARGGLGEVSIAKDLELNRDVALKEIQSRFANDEASRSRFMLEAEVTGGLEHPGIVPVYGLGRYDDGRPYYAMRFIRGDSLKDAADRFHGKGEDSDSRANFDNVDFRKLLGRFVDVCQAIEYAHSRGVLHRDLKPGNIMLGKYGETLVVDWGLAKTQGSKEIEHTPGEGPLRPASASGSAPTMMGSAIGTPAFMPPEQAAGDLDSLGPASDVYSLGATLYYLLTGTVPFSGKAIGTVLENVKQGKFPPACQINSGVPNALDAICLKAMARRPTDRYASPADLADDVENWLADEPVSAFEEPIPEKVGRWIRHHPRTVTGAGASISVALVALISFLTVVAQKNALLEERNSDLAEANRLTKEARDIAFANFKKAQSVVDEFFTEVSESKELLAGSPGTQKLRLRLLEKARDYYAEFLRENKDESIDAELGRAHIRFGDMLEQLGELEEAGEAFDSARKIFDALVKTEPNNADYLGSLAATHAEMGGVYGRVGQTQKASDAFERAISIYEPLASEYPETRVYRSDLAECYRHLGEILGARGQWEEGLQYANAANEALGPDAFDDPAAQNDIAEIHSFLSKAHQSLGNYDKAEHAIKESIRIQEAILQATPGDYWRYNLLILDYVDLATLASVRGDDSQIVEACDTAIKLATNLARENPDVLQYQETLANAYDNQSWLLRRANRFTLAIESVSKAIDVYSRLTTDYPNVFESQHDLAGSLNRRAMLYLDVDDIENGKRDSDRALAVLKSLEKDFPNSPDLTSLSALIHAGRGRALFAAGSIDEAVMEYQTGIRLFEDQLVDFANRPRESGMLVRFYLGLGIDMQGIGLTDEAYHSFERASELTRALSEEHPSRVDYREDLADCQYQLGVLSFYRGDAQGAIEKLQQSLETLAGIEEQFSNNPRVQNNLAATYYTIAEVLRAARLFPEALANYALSRQIRESLVERYPSVPAYRERLAQGINNEGVAQKQMGEIEAAKRSYAEVIELTSDHSAVALASNQDLLALGGAQVNLAEIMEMERAYEEALGLLNQSTSNFAELIERKPNHEKALQFSRNGRRLHRRITQKLEVQQRLVKAMSLSPEEIKELPQSEQELPLSIQGLRLARAGQIDAAIRAARWLGELEDPTGYDQFTAAKILAVCIGQMAPPEPSVNENPEGVSETSSSLIAEAAHLLVDAVAKGWDIEWVQADAEFADVSMHSELQKLAELANSTPQPGALLAYESFEHTNTDSPLLGREAEGFTSPWQARTYFRVPMSTNYKIVSDSLHYPDLVSQGNRVLAEHNEEVLTGIRIDLPETLHREGGTIYLSCLVRPEGVLQRGKFGGFFGGELSRFGESAFFFGKPGGTLQRYVMEEIGGRGQVASTAEVKLHHTALLVIKAQFHDGKYRATLYVNPDLKSGTVPLNGTVKTGVAPFPRALRLYSTGEFSVDEIRIGSSFSAVTPKR